MQDYTYVFPFIFIIIGGGIVFLLTRKSGDKTAETKKAKPKEIELTDRLYMCEYLGGFPNSDTPFPLVHCAVTADSFVFMRGNRDVEIGRISRDSIIDIMVGTKSQVAQQLTDQEKSFLGKISAAKKNRHYNLLLSWENSNKIKHNAVFEFYEQSAADSSVLALKKWMKQKHITGENTAKAS